MSLETLADDLVLPRRLEFRVHALAPLERQPPAAPEVPALQILEPGGHGRVFHFGEVRQVHGTFAIARQPFPDFLGRHRKDRAASVVANPSAMSACTVCAERRAVEPAPNVYSRSFEMSR